MGLEDFISWYFIPGGFVLGAFIHGVFINGAFIPHGIHRTGHSPQEALGGFILVPGGFRPRGFRSRGMVPGESQAVKILHCRRYMRLVLSRVHEP